MTTEEEIEVDKLISKALVEYDYEFIVQFILGLVCFVIYVLAHDYGGTSSF